MPGEHGLTRDAVRAFDREATLELLADPVAQWLDWEEQANLIGFRVSTVPVESSSPRSRATRSRSTSCPAPPKSSSRASYAATACSARAIP